MLGKLAFKFFKPLDWPPRPPWQPALCAVYPGNTSQGPTKSRELLHLSSEFVFSQVGALTSGVGVSSGVFSVGLGQNTGFLFNGANTFNDYN